MITYRKADIKDIQVLIDLRIDFMKEVMGYLYFSLHATDMAKPIYKDFGFTQSGDEIVLNLM